MTRDDVLKIVNEAKEKGKRADLRGADLRGADLRWADLSGANLSGADLSGADLRWADLSGANLRWADLSGANLSGAGLSGADLSEADLSGADLSEADLRGANLDFSCWPLWCGTKGVKVDIKLVRQLLAHVACLECDDPAFKNIKEAILPEAQKCHRAQELGLLNKIPEKE